MRSVDTPRVRDLLGIIADAARRLRELGAIPEDEFLGDFRNTESAKYLFVVATEAAIELCQHIAIRRSSRSPDDYADCFAILAEIDVIDASLSARLQRMARFRNLLVHLYWQVDNRRVYRAIHEDLTDLDDYRRQVAASLYL